MTDIDLLGGKLVAIEEKTHGQYRPDVDGLRAIAILPVVLFHASVRGFSGGFVGVDIFFVISGYLITNILMRDVTIGRHSISEFYRRRILRIFPALGAMLLVTTVASWFFLLPFEMSGFARALATTALFVSNIQFYSSTDYFNLGEMSQPLLHTWSLAVEEQWYILWPIIIGGVGAARQRLMWWITAAITGMSFVFGIWLLPVSPSATFYLLPTRAWELGMGALLAMTVVRSFSLRSDNILGIAGLLLIMFSVKFYTHETSFPGLAAFPPCLGAMLLIFSGRSPTWTRRLLSQKPLIYTGLISYSLYLWHWPVIVFANTGLLLPRSPVVSAGVVTVSLILAILSYLYVEQPFRNRAKKWRTSRVLAGGAASVGVILAIALASPRVSASLNHFTIHQAAIARELAFDGDESYRRGSCFQVGPRGRFDEASCLTPRGDKPIFLLVGDSHAADLWPGLERYRDRFDILQATVTGCVAGLYPLPRNYCQRMHNRVLGKWLTQHRIDKLILSSRWKWETIGELDAMLRDLTIQASHPILIGPMPEYATGLPRLRVWADRRTDPALVSRSLDRGVFALDVAMQKKATRAGITYISLVGILCKNDVCQSVAPGGASLLFDSSHLSRSGSEMLVDAMMPRIVAAVPTRKPFQPRQSNP